MIKQVLQYLYNLIAALWRNHDYDYDDVQMDQTSNPIDANVTNIQAIELYFTARCRYCGKPVNVNRYTFRNPAFRDIMFCRRDPIIYAQWLERRIERDKELSKGPISFDDQVKDFEAGAELDRQKILNSSNN